jgi:Vacuolar sorting protein 9 (VPS9) domain/Domain of unknown function (DUF5601)
MSLKSDVSDADKTPRVFNIASDGEDEGKLDYSWFVKRLKNSGKQGLQLIGKLKFFASAFPPNLTREECSDRFYDFLGNAEQWLLEIETFKGMTSEETKCAMDSLEKFMLKMLHSQFYTISPEDAIMDRLLYEKLKTMNNSEIDLVVHLQGSSIVDRLLIKAAVDELNLLKSYRAPKDKLQCFLNAQRILKHSLDVLFPTGWAADELLPLCIYTVILSKQNSLISDVNFIRYFGKRRLQGEIDYAFTQLELAVAFIRDFDVRLLRKLNEEERVRLRSVWEKIRHQPGEGIETLKSLKIRDLPDFILGCIAMDEFLRSIRCETEINFDAPLDDWLFDWYKNEFEFLEKLQLQFK